MDSRQIESVEAELVAEFQIRKTSSDLVMDILGAYNLMLEVVSWESDDPDGATKVKLFLGGAVVAEGVANDTRIAALEACRDWLIKSRARPNPLS